MTTSYSSKQKRNNNQELSELMPQNIDAEEAILGAILVSPVCMNKIVEKLKEFDFCLVKPPEFLNLAPGRRCWGFVKKEEPVTKLPRYE